MTLLINNADVSRILTMEATIDALEASYRSLAAGEGTCRPRIDIRIPTSDPAKTYQWGSMEGGSTAGYFAIRIKSDVVYEQASEGVVTQEKYCVRPGLFCGLVLLTSIENGELVAQRRRAAAHARGSRRGDRGARDRRRAPDLARGPRFGCTPGALLRCADHLFRERGNLQGAQFHAVAAKIFEGARAAGLGREIPVDWFLQDIRN
ncbi:MAG: hypothetical protein M3R58_03840 [Pseudomonadota bacterium]|nr:hypothetical protein [Pseudomonadota bacterium]